MKSKILLSLFILFGATISASAQISPGKILLGGSAGFYKSKNSDPSQPFPLYSNYESLYSSIQIGKFIKKNTAVGVILSYGYNKTSTQTSSESKVTQYSVGGFYRKYSTLTTNFYFFVEGDASYNYSKNKQQVYYPSSPYVVTTISNGGLVSFIPGISYNVWKRMQVELLMPNLASISYLHSKADYEYTNPSSSSLNKSNTFSLNTNLNSNLLSNFGIGFKFFL